MQKNFPGLPEKYFPFRDRPIIALYRIRFASETDAGIPLLDFAFLRNTQVSGLFIRVIDVRKDSSAAHLLDSPDRLGLEFEGETYDRPKVRFTSLSSLITGETPVLQYSYEMLAEQLKWYFQTELGFSGGDVSCIKAR